MEKKKKINSFLKNINEAILIKQKLFNLDKTINKTISILSSKLIAGGKILLCGNGGSAADAQHLAAEFLIRLRKEFNRKPIPALSLATDVSSLTACGNDYNFDLIFSKPLEALGAKRDILIAISTSGKSKNIINALKVSKKKKIFSIGFLGGDGGLAKKYCDISLIVPSINVARIQEAHIFIGHYIFEQVENNLIKKSKNLSYKYKKNN